MDREMMEWMKPFQKTFDQDFFKSFHHLFDNQETGKHQLKVNLYEGINELICVACLPGVDTLENVDVNVQSTKLEIIGRTDVQFDNFKLTQKEFEEGEFHRIVDLPYLVRDDKVDAVYKNGLLIIHLFKNLTQPQSTKRIIIKNIDE